MQLSNVDQTAGTHPRDWLSRDTSISLPKFLLYFATFFLPLAIVLSAVAWWAMRLDAQIRLDRVEVQEKARIEAAQKILGRGLREISTDIGVLAENPALRPFLSSPSERTRGQIIEHFRVFGEQKGIYDQVRYLNASGRELVRINYAEGDSQIVPGAQLQDKSNRYYFREIWNLDRGDIYVSPMDLNVEHGVIERPAKPVIRLGALVYDTGGIKRGMVVANYLAANLLDQFRDVMAVGSGEPMLLEMDGHWLVAPDREDEWGAALGTQKRFDLRFPRAWSAMRRLSEGSVATDKGLFVFSRIYPLRPAGAASARYRADHDYWIIVSRLASGSLPNSGAVRYSSAMFAYAVFLFVLAIILAYAAYIKVSREVWQRNLQASESRFRAVFKEASLGICLTDLNGLILDANPALTSMLGFEQAELIRVSQTQLIHSDDLSRLEGFYRELRGGNSESCTADVRYLTKAGQIINAEINLALVHTASGQPQFTVMLIEDMTPRKELQERERVIQDQLVHMNRVGAIGEMGSTLAHELNNPLGAIANYMAGSLNWIRSGGKDPTELITPLEKSLNQAKKAGDIIRRVRGFLKAPEDEVGEADLKETVSESLGLVEIQSQRQAVKIVTILAEGLPPVSVSVAQLEQVLVNVLLNAIQALAEVPVDQRRLEVSAEQLETGEVRVSVDDNGPGGDDLEQIFEPFYSTKSEGLGLGLALCCTIVESWGGRIWAENSKGRGLVVCFTMPATGNRNR
ncbi:MAG: PAS domain S-box protein [Halieaceae bacterium]|nr:PAS domain S-box protein [Halieaceae bacterium]